MACILTMPCQSASAQAASQAGTATRYGRADRADQNRRPGLRGSAIALPAGISIWAEDAPYVTLFGENEGVVFNNQYWTGLEVGQAWVHWTPAARQIIDFLEPAGDM